MDSMWKNRYDHIPVKLFRYVIIYFRERTGEGERETWMRGTAFGCLLHTATGDPASNLDCQPATPWCLGWCSLKLYLRTLKCSFRVSFTHHKIVFFCFSPCYLKKKVKNLLSLQAYKNSSGPDVARPPRFADAQTL